MRRIDYITHHCTAGPQTQTVDSILRYWRNVKKWKVPGYHIIIPADGKPEALLPIEKVSNGVGGHNSKLINIAYIGGVVTDDSDPINAKGTPIDNRTAEQKLTQAYLTRKFNEQFPNAIINGHRDFSPDKNRNGIIEPNEWLKACPSFSVKEWLEEIDFKTAAKHEFLTTTANVNIRTGPGTNHPPASSVVPKGSQVRRVAIAGDWSYVTFKFTKGYILSKYLS